MNRLITNKEHLIYHFKSYLEEFKHIDISGKSYFDEIHVTLSKLLSEALGIPYNLFSKFLMEASKNV